MKKSIILLLMILVIVFIASCVYDTVNYCPYCKNGNITETSKDIYKCNSFGKEFGAKEIIEPIRPKD